MELAGRGEIVGGGVLMGGGEAVEQREPSGEE